MGPLVEREGWGPFVEVVNGFLNGDATTDFFYFVLGPMNGVGRILRVEWHIAGVLSGGHQFGGTIGRGGDASEAAYRSGEPLLQSSNAYSWVDFPEWSFEVFDSIGKQLLIPVYRWIGDGTWYLVARFKGQSINMYARHFVSVVWERYYV